MIKSSIEHFLANKQLDYYYETVYLHIINRLGNIRFRLGLVRIRSSLGKYKAMKILIYYQSKILLFLNPNRKLVAEDAVWY